jgi:hypothetical protein
MRVTFLLLFIPCFFNLGAPYPDLLPISPSGPVEQDTLPQKPDFYTSIQRAGSRALVEWDPVSKDLRSERYGNELDFHSVELDPHLPLYSKALLSRLKVSSGYTIIRKL